LSDGPKGPPKATPHPGIVSTLIHAGIRLTARAFPGADTREPGLPDHMPEEVYVEGNGVNLHCLRWTGNGTPLVLLHGLDANSWIWAPIASLLKKEREPLSCCAIDLRGHGLSSSPDSGYDLATTCGDVLAALDRLGIDRFALMGHSWGGKVATYLASEIPERVRGLVLADPVPPAGFNPMLRAMPGLVDAVLGPERGPYADARSLETGVTRMVYLKRWDEMDRKLVYAGFRQQPDGGFRHSLSDSAYREILDGALQEDITDRLGSITCPALLLLPTFTVSFWPGESRQYARGLGDGLTIRRVRGDHSFIYTNPVDTTREMEAFLKTVPA